MVCPNCHSDNIIEVQGQHFCINCGQALPQTAIEANGVQADGLPLGVKILPTSGIPEATRAGATGTAVAEAPAKTAKAAKAVALKATAAKAPDTKSSDPKPAEKTAPKDSDETPLILKSRSRIKIDDDQEGTESAPQDTPESASQDVPEPEPKAKKRKPGRPKAGRLDTPSAGVAMTAPALPDAPQLGGPKPAATNPVPAPVPSPPAPDAPLEGPRRMSDIAVRKAAAKPKPKPSHYNGHSKLITIEDKAKPDATDEPEKSNAKPDHKRKHKHKAFFTWPKHQAKHQPKRHHVHKVGAPSLHFGAVMNFSLRAAVRRRHVGLATLAAASFAAAVGYGLWLFFTEGPDRLAASFQHLDPTLIAQLAGLASLYYIGRSVGQSALTYGVAREADQRPVPLAKQLGVGVNTFGRHLTMDLLYGLIQLALIAVIVILVVTGGQTWPIDIQWQMGALFVAFLLLLYLISAMAITRGLAGVALTLTSERPKTAIKLGWRLFSHRFELLGLRFLAAAVELLVALPLAALAVAFVAAAPAGFHLAVTLGVAIIAWLAGALIGAGTAAWWAALYRQLVLADHPDGAVNLLSSRQPAEANRGPLALLVSVSTLLVVAVLVLPWIKL